MGGINQFLLYDELPLWSAPFGLTLLDTIKLRKGINILDIGSGAGFPMLEIAERAGKSTMVYGIDPSEASIQMISEKIKLKGITNAIITQGVAEELPFDDHFFGLIVANNGINNVRDDQIVLSECFRVLSDQGQMVLTMNLPHTMIEFYEAFESVLHEHKMESEVVLMNSHIQEKRKSIEFWKTTIETAGFIINSINVDGFRINFSDGTSFLEHYFVRTAFRKPWEKITNNPIIYKEVEDKLNRIAEIEGELSISVPYVCFDCKKSN